MTSQLSWDIFICEWLTLLFLVVILINCRQIFFLTSLLNACNGRYWNFIWACVFIIIVCILFISYMYFFFVYDVAVWCMIISTFMVRNPIFRTSATIILFHYVFIVIATRVCFLIPFKFVSIRLGTITLMTWWLVVSTIFAF